MKKIIYNQTKRTLLGFRLGLHEKLLAIVILLTLTSVTAFAQFTITSHPVDRIDIQEGTSTTFSVGVTPPGFYSYQWYYYGASNGYNFDPVVDNAVYSGAATETLTILNVTTALHGNSYFCAIGISAGLPASDFSYSAYLTVKSSKPTPEIIKQPEDYSAAEGYGATFSVTVSGADQNVYLYQWYYNTYGHCDGGHVALTDGGAFSGVNTSTLTIDPATLDIDSYLFSCEVIAPEWGSWRDVSNCALLSVESPTPGITSHPDNRTIPVGSNTSFGIATAFDEVFEYRYQWQYRVHADSVFKDVANGGIYSGATTLTLSLRNVPVAYDNYEYRCIVTVPKISGWIEYSNSAKLTLTEAPKITTPSLPEAEIDKPYNVTLTATGTAPITWSLVSSSLPAGLSLDGATGVISGIPTKTGPVNITVRARNEAGYDTKVYSLVVTEPKAPPVIEITYPTNSPPFCTVNDFLSVPFKKIDQVNPMKYSLRFSEDAKAAGFKDTPFANLPVDMAFKIDVPKGAPSKAYAATIIITREGTGEYKDEYPFTFSITNNGVVIVNQPPAFQLICGGASIALSVDITGKASDYQWFINGQAIAGAKGKEYMADKAGIYYVEVRGECGEIKSTEAVITSPSSMPGSVNVRVKWGTVLYVENAAAKYKSYQWYRNGVEISGATSVYITEKDGFLGEYYVKCFKADGSSDETCPVVFDVRTRGAVGVYPSIIKTNEALNIQIADPAFTSETLTGFQTLLGLDGIEATVEIYSLLGVKVYSAKITTPITTIQPDLRNKGNYFVMIKLSSGEVFTEKIIVE